MEKNRPLLKMPMLSSPSLTASRPTLSRPALALLLSLSTTPVLLAIVGTQALTRLLEEMGQSSEELLRGDRLPPLGFPLPPQPEQTLTPFYIPRSGGNP
uniref:Uncharacterized protein n=1 Tax=Cyanothece sp. (strain PCC 7425 / ATCC 29141) TaxID=395961 RepID=B8HVD0_CYAP4